MAGAQGMQLRHCIQVGDNLVHYCRVVVWRRYGKLWKTATRWRSKSGAHNPEQGWRVRLHNTNDVPREVDTWNRMWLMFLVDALISPLSHWLLGIPRWVLVVTVQSSSEGDCCRPMPPWLYSDLNGLYNETHIRFTGRTTRRTKLYASFALHSFGSCSSV